MTISFMAGRRIQGLSTDYVPAITDVSDSNWTVTGSDYAINSGVIDWEGVRSSSVKGIHIDLGAGNISDTKWVLRFKMVTDASSVGTSGSNIIYIAVSDAGVQSHLTGSEDSLGYYERSHSGGAHKQTVGYGDGQNLLENVNDFNTNNPSTGTKYIEMKRTSATSFTVTRYSDEFVTTLETAKTITIPSTVQSLRYIKIQNKEESPAGGTFNGTISNVQFWNDTTTAGVIVKDYLANVQSGSRFEETDTRKIYYGALGDGSADFTSDFSSSTGWTSSDTGAISVDTGNEDISWTVSRGTNDSMSYDLGAGNVSDTAWILRWRTRWSNLSNSATNQQWIGISSLDYSNAHNIAQDFLGTMSVKFGIDGVRSTEADGEALPASGDVAWTSPARSTNTWYYFELKRTSSTSFEFSVSSTASYSKDLYDSGSLTCVSTITGLRYIKLSNENAGTGSDGTASETKDFKFWNGVTSVPQTIQWTEES